jgi:hypothetical protein
MLGLRRTEPSYVDCALGEQPVHPIKRNGSAHVPAGTELLPVAGGRDGTAASRWPAACSRPIKKTPGFQHGVHDAGKFGSNGDDTVDFTTLGPVGRSAVEVRCFHLATVFWLTPWRRASALRHS